MRGTRTIALVLAAIVLGACADWNTGQASSVIDAHVVRIVSQGTSPAGQPGLPGQPVQTVELQLDGGLYRGDHVTLEWAGRVALNANGLLAVGDHVLVSQRRVDDANREYAIEDVVRLPSLLPFAVALVVALLVVARWKGLASLAGLAGGIAVFLLAIVPAVQRGEDPLVATLGGSLAVVAIAIFVVHGFGRASLAALGGTVVCLCAVVALAALALSAARITGFGSADAAALATGAAARIDLHRLVLAGIVVGSLGALVDLGIGQASATFALAAAHDELRGPGLYLSALRAGRDHLGSLMTTIALAYFGGAMPLIVLLSLGNQPLAQSANGETIVGAIIAVLAASLGLVLCLPITTGIAVVLADGRRPA
jgi:uncharacterized membrane protein